MRFLFSIINCIFTLVIISLNIVFSAKIIFLFAGGNPSHKIGIWPFVLALAQRGHQITYFSSDPKPFQSHPNIKDVTPEAMVQASGSFYNVDRFKVRQEGKETGIFKSYFETSLDICKSLLTSNDSQVVDIINNVEQYDLAIVNSVFGECNNLIVTNYGCKYIAYGPNSILMWYHETHGLPWEAAYIPHMLGQYGSYPLGYFDRISNAYAFYKWSGYEKSFTNELENLMKKRFNQSETVPSYLEMERGTSLVFYNAHHTIDYARALPPNFIPIGGMQCYDKIGNLSEKFQTFMDSAQDGVILIAFGTTMDLSRLSSHYLQIFFNMMKKFSSVRFIWRWKGEMPENSPENLLGDEWLPQKEILSHRKTIGFMTHCGHNSITEATCFGVPLIGVPLFGDQDYSAYRLEAQEIGVKLEIKGLTQEIMDSTVEKVLQNPKYKQNMMIRSKLLKDQPLRPVDTAVYWTEFVLKHDDMSSFKPMALEQPWWVRNLLDVYFTFFIVFTMLPLFLMYCLILLTKKLIINKLE